MLSHDVYFTLAEPTPDNINALAAECREYLSGHPGTVFFAAGPCNPDLDRPVNDRDFHVALHVVFESREAHDIYQTDPRHLTFIERNKASWAKVRVFDSDVEA
ncbi:MAG: Dabb family protein [Planctomycetota bacterium]|nr:Dabb family protein [Planctomycetota bacterium]MEC8304537.1 Dabb family protein [Planctomycetota bacterium]MEC8389483.1 Dabb family protein [Planctomycetota bacterium]MEC8801915.1 Dabb family protein [Planctomycetota bacterium]